MFGCGTSLSCIVERMYLSHVIYLACEVFAKHELPLVFWGDAPEEDPCSALVYVVVDPPSPGPQRAVEGFLSGHLDLIPVPLEMVPSKVRQDDS